jgi:hypothetical protein
MKEVIDEIDRALSVILGGMSGFTLALAYFKDDPYIKMYSALLFLVLFSLTCMAYKWTKRMKQ